MTPTCARTPFLSAVLLASALLSPALGWADTWEPLDPVPGAAPVRVLVGGKPRVYYRITPQAPLAIRVTGPGRLRLVTRAELAHAAPGPISYRLRISEGRRQWKEHATESSPTPKARLEEGEANVCKSRSLVVRLPAGGHDIQIATSGGSSVLVRLLVSTSKRHAEAMVSITPIDATRSVTVSEGERLIPYYTVVHKQPVRLRIVGPTRLELSSRLDFDATMRGAQRYTIAVSSAGRRLREARLTTTKAVAAAYTDLKDRIPSKLDRTILSLGPGLHELTVELLDPPGGVAEIHARIPQPSVGSEE